MLRPLLRKAYRSTMTAAWALTTASFIWAAAAARADTLTIAVPSDPGYLDPAYWGSTVDQFLIDNLYPRLAKYAPGDEGTVELDAAKSVDLSDPMKIGFELKPGIMWTGGYGELTAEDVEYSFERHIDPNLESGAVTEFQYLKDVEVTGKYTGIIHLTEPNAPFWNATLTFTSGAIISKAAADEAGGWFESTPTATTGAYMLKEFKPGNKLVLERNPDWTGETGDFDEIVLLPISDENAAELAFAAGEIDYTRTSAANYDTLAATTGGHGLPSTGFVPAGFPGHREEVTLTRDVDQARALLTEAGADGLVVRLDYTNTTTRDTAAQIMQANLAEVGITLDLNGQDEGTFWSVDEIRAADLQLHLKAWTGNPEGYYTMQYFIEDQIGYWNWEGYASSDYDALLAEARATTDEATRGAIYQKMQTMLEDSGSFVFVSQEPTVILHRDTIIPGILPDGRPVFHAFKKAE